MSYEIVGNDIRLLFNVPCPPLCLDTINVNKVDNYGFNVIRHDGTDIISKVDIDDKMVILTCIESPLNCKLRYGINGEFLKGGRTKGPRGNLRDSNYKCPQWALLFEYNLSNFIGNSSI